MTPFELEELKKEIFITKLDGGSVPGVGIVDQGEVKLIICFLDMRFNGEPIVTKSIRNKAFDYAKKAIN